MMSLTDRPRVHVPKPFKDAMWIAVEYDTSYVGPEHVLVAILRSPGGCGTFLNRTLPNTALDESVALLHGAQALDGPNGVPRQGDDSPRPNPAFYTALGRAQGFAAALSDSGAEEVAALLALWWADSTGVRSVLLRWGLGESEIGDLLHETGYATPRSYPKA